ncbi:MAG: hypothetical protein PHD73_09565 [Sediminibacterium sp.]|nr:hypothetical protein [Sediminibacterium sp.]
MVIGLDLFTQHFIEYTDHYILIGGSACDVQMATRNAEFRATKDLDIILVVEALSPAFVNHFWDFIKDGEYTIAEVGNKKRFYRFIKPQVAGYPVRIELFSRHPETLPDPPADMHITDIPTEEEASSLSAILLDETYYGFAIDNCDIIDGLRLANDRCLVCLKTRAFLNNRERKANGAEIHDVDIYKHRRDVLQLMGVIDPTTVISVPESIQTDLENFIVYIGEEPDTIAQILKDIELDTNPEEIIQLMRNIFSLA